MITINLNDDYMEENLQAITELRSIGFSDEEIQKLYNKQFEKDKSSDNNGE